MQPETVGGRTTRSTSSAVEATTISRSSDDDRRLSNLDWWRRQRSRSDGEVRRVDSLVAGSDDDDWIAASEAVMNPSRIASSVDAFVITSVSSTKLTEITE